MYIVCLEPTCNPIIEIVQQNKMFMVAILNKMHISAHRALGLVIVKSKDTSGLLFDCYSKLYSSVMQSVLDYGACAWGFREFDCIKAVQIKAIRFFLGVHKTCNCKYSNSMRNELDPPAYSGEAMSR